MPEDRALQRALLAQLADRSLGRGLVRRDAAARQHGVLPAVEAAYDDQQLVTADDHGHGPRGGVAQRHPSRHFLPDFSPTGLVESAAMKASWGTSTRPTIFIRFLPSFCFSSSFRLRVMSPP